MTGLIRFNGVPAVRWGGRGFDRAFDSLASELLANAPQPSCAPTYAKRQMPTSCNSMCRAWPRKTSRWTLTKSPFV